MSNTNHSVAKLSEIIPDFFYDLISRIIPGWTILALCGKARQFELIYVLLIAYVIGITADFLGEFLQRGFEIFPWTKKRKRKRLKRVQYAKKNKMKKRILNGVSYLYFDEIWYCIPRLLPVDSAVWKKKMAEFTLFRSLTVSFAFTALSKKYIFLCEVQLEWWQCASLAFVFGFVGFQVYRNISRFLPSRLPRRK